MAAWPGLDCLTLDGWHLRFGEGHTKRANSATLLRNGGVDPAIRLAKCDQWFAARHLTPCVRLSDFADDATAGALERAGYGPRFDTTVTLWRPLVDAEKPVPTVEITTGSPNLDWLNAKDRISQDSHADTVARRNILAAIKIPTAYGALRGPDGTIASLAYVGVHERIASLNMVATDPLMRGLHMAEIVCATLLAWAKNEAGAVEACLQAVEANVPARRLYARMGFGSPVYRYHYRLKDVAL